jgi:hypothetical protein
MRRGLLVIAGLAGLVVATAAYALLSQHAVKTTKLHEDLPAAATGAGLNYFAWTQNSRAHPKHYDALLTRTGDSRVKLNRKGQGFMGGIDPPRVAYQQVVNGQSDIKLYDADAKTRSNPPGVNTAQWEWEPSISGDWILFGRQDTASNKQYVVLHNTGTAADFILDQGLGPRAAGQVNGDYAVWTRCDGSCDVYRRQISGPTDVKLQKPLATTYQYGPSVTSTGIVYVARSGRNCGSNVRIVRYFGASDTAKGTVVAQLGSGRDMFGTYARENADGSVDVFYDRLSCSNAKVSDIYRIHDPHPGP